MVTLAERFKDQPLTGGQTAPRLYRWVNELAQFAVGNHSNVDGH